MKHNENETCFSQIINLCIISLLTGSYGSDYIFLIFTFAQIRLGTIIYWVGILGQWAGLIYQVGKQIY